MCKGCGIVNMRLSCYLKYMVQPGLELDTVNHDAWHPVGMHTCLNGPFKSRMGMALTLIKQPKQHLPQLLQPARLRQHLQRRCQQRHWPARHPSS